MTLSVGDEVVVKASGKRDPSFKGKVLQPPRLFGVEVFVMVQRTKEPYTARWQPMERVKKV